MLNSLDVIPTPEEEAQIFAEIRDHSAYWKSDRCKLATVTRHLSSRSECHPNRKGLSNVEAKIQWLIVVNKLELLPSRSGDYVRLHK